MKRRPVAVAPKGVTKEKVRILHFEGELDPRTIAEKLKISVPAVLLHLRNLRAEQAKQEQSA